MNKSKTIIVATIVGSLASSLVLSPALAAAADSTPSTDLSASVNSDEKVIEKGQENVAGAQITYEITQKGNIKEYNITQDGKRT